VAKVGGAAVVARLYVLTLPTLRALSWFERLHDRFMALKDRWIGRLRASRTFRHGRHKARRIKRALRHLLRPAVPFGSRHASHTSRILRRFAALWRARRRQSTQTERE
jgi:hypothetical protein